jgi:hypothetical protein
VIIRPCNPDWVFRLLTVRIKYSACVATAKHGSGVGNDD